MKRKWKQSGKMFGVLGLCVLDVLCSHLCRGTRPFRVRDESNGGYRCSCYDNAYTDHHRANADHGSTNGNHNGYGAICALMGNPMR